MRLSTPLVATLAVFAAASASAQTLGTYAGTSADGSTLSFTVTTDAATGAPELTSASISFKVVCLGGAPAAYSGIGFGPSVDFKNGKLTYVSGQPTPSYFDFTLAFNKANSTLTGSIATTIAQLAVATKAPKKAIACISAKQTLTTTLQPGSVAASRGSQAGTYVFDRHGRVIGTQTR